MKILLLFISLLLVSCFQEEKVFTLNPDGSGKVEWKAIFPLDSMISMTADGEEEKSLEQKAKDAVAQIFKKSEGVDAWANVSYKITDEGKIQFQGTAYFSDLNKLKLQMGSIESNTLTPTWSKKNGLFTIECELAKEEDGAAKPGKAAPKWADMTKQQQQAGMAKARQGLKQMQGMLAGIAGDMSSKVTIQLPAPAKKSTGFKKLTNSSFNASMTGEMMLKGIDKVLANEKVMQDLARDFDPKGAPPAEVMQEMFGLTENPVVSCPASAKPAFNYKKELQAARKAAPAMMKKLGLVAIPAAPMTGKAQFKSLRLAGLRIVTPAPDQSIRAFNWTAGTAISFIAELPGAVISAEGGNIETFMLDNGQNLLSSKSWDKKPRSISLSEDGTFLEFEVESDQLPNADAKAIKLLKGEIICLAATTTKVTDLAFAKIESGQKSKHYGAEITKISKSKYQKNKKEISIRIELDRELIKEVKIFDKNGTQLESRRTGYSWSGSRGTMTFLCDNTLSVDSVVKIEIYNDLKKHVIPFVIENTPLMPKKK